MSKMSHKPAAGTELARVRNRSLAFLGFAFFFSVFVNLLMLTGPLFML